LGEIALNRNLQKPKDTYSLAEIVKVALKADCRSRMKVLP